MATKKSPTQKQVPPKTDPCACHCGKQITFFENKELAPGQAHDSGIAMKVDCYHFLHVWVLAKHPSNLTANVWAECVFEIPGKMGATALADLTNPYTPANSPQAMETTFKAGGGFILRVPVVGPQVRVIIRNTHATLTHKFSVYGYLTR